MLQNHKLGLCCLTVGQPQLKMRSMTRKRFLNLDRKTACIQLSERILNNCHVTYNTIKFCSTNRISHYRLSSSIFPLIGEENCGVSLESLGIKNQVESILREAGNFAMKNNVTLSSHPSQFTVLFSDDQKITRNSIFDLELHSYLHSALGLPQDYSNPINIHPTGKFEAIDVAAQIFIANLGICSKGVRSRLVLENCDGGIWNCQKLCELHRFLVMNKEILIPLTYDNLHDECLPSPTNTFLLNKFKKTWGDFTPIFHWSEGGANGKKRSHLDYFTHVPQIVLDNSDVIWECEVKAKNLAIEKIRNLK